MPPDHPRDITDLILSGTWRDHRNTGPKPLPASLSQAIQECSEAWTPAIPLLQKHLREYKARLARAPRSMREATLAKYALDLMLVWWVTDGHEPDPQRMLTALHISEFKDALRRWDYRKGTINAYIPALNTLATYRNPDHMKEWKAMGETPTSKVPHAMPYTAAQETTLFEWAWAQPTVYLRDGLLGWLYLGLGVGMYHGPLTEACGTDVREGDDGWVRVRLGTAWLLVRPRYSEGLLRLAERVGPDRFVPGASGKNKTSEFKADLKLPKEPVLKVEQLAATYRWWLGRHLGPDVLVNQCGPNALVHLSDIYRKKGPPEDPAVFPIDPANDLEDGPWAPDWPARHHRHTD